MAWAHVSSGAVTNGTTSVAPTFGAATLAADFLSAVVAANGATAAITCSDGTWTKIGEANAGAGAARVAVFVKPNCGAGETAPTFSATGAGNMHAILREHSGGPTTTAGITFKTATGTATTLTATLTAADSQAGNLLISGDFNRPTSSGAQAGSADSYNNGATPTGNENNDATSTFHHYRFAWGVTTGNGSADSNATSGWTQAGGANNVATILVSVPSAAVDGNATGSIPTLTLGAPAATGAGGASGTGAPGTLTLSAPAATGAGGSLGSGSIGTLTLSAPSGTARAGAAASASLGTLVLSAITGSAAVTGALVGGSVVVGRIARRVAGHAVRGLAGHAATRIAGHAARALAGRIPRRTP